MFDVHQVAKRITELRRARGLSQMQLAEQLEISFQAVSNWERGLSMPDIAKLPELADILHSSIDGIFGRDAGECCVEHDHVEKQAEACVAECEPLGSDTDETIDADNELGVPTEDNSITLSSLCALAPFMSSEALSELASTVSEVDPGVLCGLAPFLKQPTLNALARKLLDNGSDAEYSLGQICGLAPFLSQNLLGELARRATDVEPAHLAGLAPFLDRQTVDSIVNSRLRKING